MLHLVTGGSGFLGSRIVKRLHERGEKVKVLDLWKEPTLPSQVDFHKGDVLDASKVVQVMTGVGIVHHAAALVPVTRAGKRFHHVNVNGSRIVAEAAVHHRVKRFMEIGSSAIYGACHCPITVDSPKRPVEPYGQSKWDAEQEVTRICERSHTDFTVLRPRAILGGGRLGVFELLFDWIHEGKNVYTIGSGDQYYQFIHVDDLLDAYFLLMDKGIGGAHNVGTDRFGTLRQALENLISYAETSSVVHSVPKIPSVAILRLLYYLHLSPLTPWHYLTYHKEFYFDVTPMKRLGWKPKYSNDEMLRESYDWFVEHRHREGGESAHTRPLKAKALAVLKHIS